MPRHKPFDVSPKAIAEQYPADWLRLLGWPADDVKVIESDVATISGAADKVIRVGGSEPWLAIFEFMSVYKAMVPERLHWHSTLLKYRHQMLARSVVVLLRPQADGPILTGEYTEAFAKEDPYLTFHYRVLRLWEIPAEQLLASGLGASLFAPLGRLDRKRVLETVRAVRKRVRAERPDKAPELLSAMYILMGLRYDEAMINLIEKEVDEMEESISYQRILKKGEARGETRGEIRGELKALHKMLILMGSTQFGPADAATERKIRTITDVGRLERLVLAAKAVPSWRQLLKVK